MFFQASDALSASDIYLLSDSFFKNLMLFLHQTFSSIRRSSNFRNSIVIRCFSAIRCFFKNLLLFHHQTFSSIRCSSVIIRHVFRHLMLIKHPLLFHHLMFFSYQAFLQESVSLPSSDIVQELDALMSSDDFCKHLNLFYHQTSFYHQTFFQTSSSIRPFFSIHTRQVSGVLPSSDTHLLSHVSWRIECFSIFKHLVLFHYQTFFKHQMPFWHQNFFQASDTLPASDALPLVFQALDTLSSLGVLQVLDALLSSDVF